MPKSILITYTIRNNSDWEVAERVAKELEKNGAKVDILPARKVSSLAEYQAVVLGAPLYMFKWHKDLQRFLTKHHTALGKLPMAIFVVGSSLVDGEKSRKGAREQIDEVLEKFPRLDPVSLEIFDVKFDQDTPLFSFNLFQKPNPPSEQNDLMDWDAISKWAAGLVKKFG